MVKRTSSRQETEGKRDLAGSQEHAVAALGYNGNEGCPFRNAGFTMECRFESAMSDAEKLPDPIVVAPAEKVKLFPLAPWRDPVLVNYRGITTGQLRPVVELQRIEG